MPDHRVSSARPGAHRRGRRRRSPAEQVVYQQVRVAVVVPLMVVAVSLGAASIAWQMGLVTAGSLVIWIGCGVVAAVVVGLWRARAAAGAVFLSQSQSAVQLVTAVHSVGVTVRMVVEDLQRGGSPSVPPPPAVPQDGGPFVDVHTALAQLQGQVACAVIQAHERSRLAVLHEMFRHIARREHALVVRLLDALEDVQNHIKSAGLLNRIFRIDNFAVRLRRLVESLAILGGESASTVRHPVTVTNVVRAAIQAIEQYERARVVPGSTDAVLALPGHVAPDVTHLLAELAENATDFSDPATSVELGVELVPEGLVIEVVDRARPMPMHMREAMNRLLAAPESVDIREQLEDGRIGLLVVGMLRARHGIHVTLNRNSTGGTTARVVIPRALLTQVEPDPVLVLAGPASTPHRPSSPPSAPATAHAGTTVSGLPRRSRQTMSDSATPEVPAEAPGRPRLPVRPPAVSLPDPSDEAGPQAAAGRPTVVNTNLAGAFRKGTQRSQQVSPQQSPDQ
ncbi:ATP-binding protein [Streptomyces antimycoticus]|uniref:ATP-binding protein n=1 Tax=Streptomyces antimycoticus TaxID=68175 RepID=UPI0034295C05